MVLINRANLTDACISQNINCLRVTSIQALDKLRVSHYNAASSGGKHSEESKF